MKKVLFLTNYPSPYRVRFFDELGKRMDVTVLFADRIEEKKHRSAAWYVPGEGHFRSVQLTKRIFSVGTNSLCRDVLDWVKGDYDHIVVCGYSNPTLILAMTWMRLHKRPFYMEVDGGLIRQEGKAKYQFKKSLVTLADRWLSTGRSITEYLVHYGADRDRVEEYPFSSLEKADILQEIVTQEDKTALKRELGIQEDRMLLTIGQFIPRKGFDILLNAAKALPKDTAICIVGGEPTESYITLREELGLSQVYFQGFKKKDELSKYYRAADLFVLPTREDIWGLVINEAMAYGLPVITTDRCGAGLELVEDGVNGYIVPVEDVDALTEKTLALLSSDLEKMGTASLEKIRPYTIENMAKIHAEIFERG